MILSILHSGLLICACVCACAFYPHVLTWSVFDMWLEQHFYILFCVAYSTYLHLQKTRLPHDTTTTKPPGWHASMTTVTIFTDFLPYLWHSVAAWEMWTKSDCSLSNTLLCHRLCWNLSLCQCTRLKTQTFCFLSDFLFLSIQTPTYKISTVI